MPAATSAAGMVRCSSSTPTSARSAAAVSALSDPAAGAAIASAAAVLHLPTVAAQAGPIADAAARERLTHRAYLAEVLTAECDDRDARRRIRRVNEAKFPRTKRLEDFDTTAVADLPPPRLAHLATGAWIDAGEPLVLLGDSGTGKTHCETPDGGLTVRLQTEGSRAFSAPEYQSRYRRPRLTRKSH